MRFGPNKAINILVAILVTGFLVASASIPSSAQRAGKGSLVTLHMGYMANNPKWTPTLDPAIVTDTTSSYMVQLIDANIVQIKQVGKNIVAYGDLAKSWSVSKDGKTYTFHLRPNARFANGDHVTAQDAAFSIRRALSPKTGSQVTTYDNLIQGYDKFVAGKSSSLGVKALNSTTLQVKIKQKAAYFIKAFTYPINMVLDPKLVQGKPGDTYLTTTCKANMGAGPFKPVCASNASNDVTSFYRAGSTPTLTLTPNPYYYGPKAHVKLVIPAIDSTQTAYADFLSGHLDQTFGVPSQYQSRERGKPGAIQYPGNGIEYLAPNLDEPPFNNVHCRLAIAYSIDRQSLTQKFLHGAYKPLYTVVPPGFTGFYDGKSSPHFNLAKAKSELAQCPGGLHNVTFVSRSDTSDRRTAATALQGMWATAGIDVKIKSMLRADWLKIVLHPLSSTHTDLAYNDWFMDYPDPQDYLELLLRSGTSENDMDWRNKQYDSLVAKGNSTLNEKQRAKYYIQAQKLVIGQGAFIPYDLFTNFDLVNPKVHGLVGDYALGIAWPEGNDWSKVTKS